MKLAGKHVLVTGGSRGVGKGAALGLAAEGAHVFITGRRLEALESCAEALVDAGGTCTPIVCDHDRDDDVRAAVERVSTEAGELHALVNNVFQSPTGPVFNTPFWKQPLSMWDTMHRVGLRSHYVASALAAPLLIKGAESGGALIANISSFGGASYQVNVAYGVGKAGVDRLARDMARDLRPHSVCVVSLYPGVVRTERVLAGELPFSTEVSESPEFTGRAIAALLQDDARMERSGRVHVVAELAREYGFTDTDGSTPASLRELAAEAKRKKAEAKKQKAAKPRGDQPGATGAGAMSAHEEPDSIEASSTSDRSSMSDRSSVSDRSSNQDRPTKNETRP
ncbi:MAG: SDR family NAD(P)-dependent oxidoreductase [Myxococcota bacterium]